MDQSCEWVAVYCSSSDAVDPKFFAIAEQMGKLLAENGFHLIYGGSAIGLMGRVAQTVKKHSGQIIGVIPEKISANVPHLAEYDELITTLTMHQRKTIMEDRADAFIALPGGFGTLEELLEVITLKQLQYHAKPIIILNVFGCYDHLLAHFQSLFDAALAKPQYQDLYQVVSTPEEAIAAITHYRPVNFESKWYHTKEGFTSDK